MPPTAAEEIDAALAARDLDRAEQLIFRAAFEFIAGEPATLVPADRLEAWIDDMADVAGDRAWIRFYEAWVAFTAGQPTLAHMLMRQAVEQLERTKRAPDDDERRRWRATLNVALGMTAMATGRTDELRDAFSIARDGWLGQGRDHPTMVTAEEAERFLAHDPFGARRYFLELAAITEAMAVPHALAASLNNLALFAIDRGEPLLAKRLAAASCELRRTRTPSTSYATSLNTLGMANRLAGDLLAAEDALLEARLLGERAEMRQVAAYALANVAEVAADSGMYDVADRRFEQSSAEKEAMGDSFGLAYGWRAWARAKRREGDTATALSLAQRAWELRQSSLDPNERSMLLAELGAALIETGDLDHGLARLDDAAPLATAIGAAGTTAAIHAYRALASGRAADVEAAREQVERLGLRSLDLEIARAEHRAPGLAVRARLIGEFALRIGRNVVSTDGWKSRRAGEVLRVLALHRGRLVHVDNLLDWVWPDEGLAARPSLNAALTVIRRALEAGGGERDLLVREGDRYGLARFSGSDVDRFESMLSRASTASTSGREVLSLALYMDALGPWHNAELLAADRYAPWAEAERQRLEYLVQDARQRAAELQLSQQQPELALALATEAVIAEPAREAAHRLVIRAHLQRGDRAAAHQAYDECVRLLDAEVGVEPSPLTTALLAT